MAFPIEFYTFEKRENSTARPVGSGKFILDGTLKEASGMYNPVIRCKLSLSNEDVARYNYAYIRVFKRFYFIQEWSWDSGFWIANMKEDVLASWRDEIGELEEYVVRSSQESDGSIIDYYYPTTAKVTRNVNNFRLNGYSSEFGDSNGCFIMGVTQGRTVDMTVGGITYYILTERQANAITSYLLSDNIFDNMLDYLGTVAVGLLRNGSDITHEYQNKEFLKFNINPIQYIKSLYWLPYKPTGSASTAPVCVGYWYVNAVAHTLNNSTTLKSKNLPVPKHPQAATRGSYLNLYPYSRYILHLGQFGSFPLDSMMLSGVSNLDVICNFDPVSGMGQVSVEISGDTNTFVILQTEAKVAVEIPITQISRDVIGTFTTMVGGASSVTNSILGLDVAGAVGGTANALGSTISNWQPVAVQKGNSGNAASLKLGWTFEAEFLEVVEEDKANIGRPLCKKRVIKNLAQYMKIMNPNVSLPATQFELHAIKSYMEGGFYWQ